MKMNQSPVTRSGNLPSLASKKMGVGNWGVVMSILSNMYTDAYDAVVREYAANGLDSHVKAGNSAPVLVSLPTDMQPTLLVQDYGVGLSRDEIFNVFAEYATSTKVESDDEVGGFGIGAKSAFTLGQQFIVTGVKDGRKTVAVFSLDVNNEADVDIVHDGETTEPNGVLVSLAVEDVWRMHESATRVFSTWKRGTVLVDGVEPTPVYESGTDVNDTVTIVPDHDGFTFVAVGPVAYKVSRQTWEQVAKRLDADDTAAASVVDTLVNWNSIGTSSSLFFRLDIGDVDIAPNREFLRDSRKTLGVLTALVTSLGADLVSSIQDKVDAAPSAYAAALISKQEREGREPFKIPGKAIKLGGRKIHGDVKVSLPTVFLGDKSWRSTTKVVRITDEHVVTLENADKVVVITGLSDADHYKVTRYAKRFLESDTNPYEHILLTPATAASYSWFEYGVAGGAATMTLEDYRVALKALRANSPRTLNEPSYSTGFTTASRDLDDRDTLSEIIEWGKDIIVVENSAASYAAFASLFEDYTIVVLLGTQSRNALEKRIAADATVEIADVSMAAVIRAHAVEVVGALTDDERLSLAAWDWSDYHVRARVETWNNWGQALGEDIAAHPVFREAQETLDIVALQAADMSKARVAQLQRLIVWAGEALPQIDVEIPSFSERFPLLENMSTWRIDRNPALLAEVRTYVLAKISA